VEDIELISYSILLANLWGICTSRSRKTATKAMVTTNKNSTKEKNSVVTQRKIEEFVLDIKNFLKNILNTCIFSFKYHHLTYYHH
jgi:hypothetical protein